MKVRGLMDREFEQVRAITKDVEGRLAPEEAELLYLLAKDGEGEGQIFEIGSYHGYSTIWLASGSKCAGREKVYAIDPHIMEDHGNNEVIFKNNIKKAKLEEYVVPIVAASAEAERDWIGPVRLLFIDGAHDYVNAKNDFLSWEKHLNENGIVAFHDYLSISCPGVTKVVEEYIFESDEYSVLGCANTVIYAKKAKKITPLEKLEKESMQRILLPRQNLENAFQRAEALIKDLRYDEAENLLGACERNIGSFFPPMYRIIRLSAIAANFRKIGRYEKAERIYRAILDYENVPLLEKYGSLLNMGQICFAEKKYDEAIEKFQEALGLDGATEEKRVELILGIGLCYSELGKKGEEEKEYLKALSLKNLPGIWKYRLLNRLGNIYLGYGRYDDAVQKLLDALSIENIQGMDRYHALIRLGKCYYGMGNYSMAAQQLEEAFSYKDITDEAKYLISTELINCYLIQGRFQEIENACAKLLSLKGVTEDRKRNIIVSVKQKIQMLREQCGGANA